jgi:hypothetical protein
LENLQRLVFRWRHAVLALELVIAATFVGLGLSLLHTDRSSTQAVTLGGASANTAVPPRWGLVQAVGASPAGASRSSSALPGLNPDLVRRLNQDDLTLYHQQWRAVEVITDGIRRYLERWVLPQLSSPGTRG